MRRTPIQRRTPLRTKRPPPRPVKTYEVFNPKPRPVAVARGDGKARMVAPIPKQCPVQHEGYMAAVRTLRCARCGWFREGGIQFCHSDEGKGMGLKTDCRLGWPGCGPHDGLPGCHWIVGTSGQLTKAERRAFESLAAADTRAEIKRRGLWPRALAKWIDDEVCHGMA